MTPLAVRSAMSCARALSLLWLAACATASEDDALTRSHDQDGPPERADDAASTASESVAQVAAATPADVPSATCAAATRYAAGDNRVSLQHGGRARRFVVYVPRTLPPAKPVPLVLDFHGNGGSATQEEGSSGWRQKADKEGFIAVYPDGIGGGWNVGNCCGQALAGKVDDVGFARAIVKEVSAAACIDPKRIYATGLSNGAGLAHRLACEAADVFAAIAAASADLVTDPCKPARPISELSVRGLNDRLVAYEGGNTGSTGWFSPGAKGTLALWKNINGCTGAPVSKRRYCETYEHCQGETEATLCSLPNTGHILYNNSVGFNVPEVAWELFLRQPMP
jgi:polyhydroxybutyrate depolymerase